MSDSIKCVCGYRGPSVPEGEHQVCPICRGRVRGAASFLPAGAAAADAVADAEEESLRVPDPVVYRIPCPNGHVIKAREEMLGEQVCCPECNEFFVLRATDSVEFRRQQAQRQVESEARAAEAWLKRAIVAAVIIGLSFIAMLVLGLNPGLIRR